MRLLLIATVLLAACGNPSPEVDFDYESDSGSSVTVDPDSGSIDASVLHEDAGTADAGFWQDAGAEPEDAGVRCHDHKHHKGKGHGKGHKDC